MFQQSQRGLISASAVLVAVVLAADAVAALATTIASALILPLYLAMTGAESVPGHGVPVLLAGSALTALSCPVVATLVAGVRTPAAHLTGCVVTALIIVGVAGLGALALRYDLPNRVTMITGVLFVANVVALTLVIGLLRPAESVPDLPWPASE
ncbi:hypothetical protein [Actinoplanes flavus]|uniref:Uncharacterized protein n=1 Tax=Actinoplanes flavus TaxID=2820290 RepID=A0ABS3UFK1_9ACTN|nr:hypothetical protein [Actinoplanes flavus]MBO3737541.1 hypothetical protein [Actinoplanes flavus]